MQKPDPKTIRIQREKLRRTDEILQAARKIMIASSYTGATMDDIAAEAGITKPTIYQYFKTKDELFLALMEPLIVSLALKLEEIKKDIDLNKYKSGKTILHDVYNAYLEMFTTDPDLFRIFNIFFQVGINADINVKAIRRIREIRQACYIAGQSIAAAAISRGYFRDVDILHATEFVWASFWGTVQVELNEWNSSGVSPSLKPVLEFTENMVIHALVRK